MAHQEDGLVWKNFENRSVMQSFREEFSENSPERLQT
jgi:hypothetical protein